MTLGQKYGELAGMVLTAYETGNETEKRMAVSNFQRELRIWYESAPVENRREFARQTRKFAEHFGQVAELARMELNTLTLQDAA